MVHPFGRQGKQIELKFFKYYVETCIYKTSKLHENTIENSVDNDK